jgi:hypothetical protein
MQNQSGLWHFDRIAAQDAKRADALQAAPSRLELMRMVAGALGLAVSNGDVHIGFDESGKNAKHLRAVIQFHVGQQIFDWFFNAHTGYRAQFRHRWEDGQAHNVELVTWLCGELRAIEREEISARRLSASFEDRGSEQAPVSRVLASLDPRLSKVWFCKKLIQHDGKVSTLHVELSGPRLVFDDHESWAAPCADESDAWLDLKGAFVGETGLYQIKDPELRAKEMQRLGSA